MPNEPVILGFQNRGTLALPADLRRRHNLGKPGAQVRVVEREDGVVELHPLAAVPADQAWFWTERWQEMERDADADVAAGRVTNHDTVEELFHAADGCPSLDRHEFQDGWHYNFGPSDVDATFDESRSAVWLRPATIRELLSLLPASLRRQPVALRVELLARELAGSAANP